MKNKFKKFATIETLNDSSNKIQNKEINKTISKDNSNELVEIRQDKTKIVKNNPQIKKNSSMLILKKENLIDENLNQKNTPNKKKDNQIIEKFLKNESKTKKFAIENFSNYYLNRNGGCLEIKGITKFFKKKIILNDINLKVESGKIVGLIGPNGAGKSTLFNLILGQLSPNSGNIFFDGKSVLNLPTFERTSKVGIQFLPQQSCIYQGLSVEDNIKSHAEIAIKDKEQQLEVVEYLLNEFKISNLRHSNAKSLSGGERKRCEIARCLVTSPRLLILDEPYSGLDILTIQDLNNYLLRLKRKNIGILISEHNVREALQICDYAYVLASGKIISSGNPQQIANDSLAKKIYFGENFRF